VRDGAPNRDQEYDMCGIAGFYQLSAEATAPLETLARTMADAIRHRGPDDAGAWADADAGIALGHRRLAIIDLSPAGHQPMASASGRYVVIYNGEIYNHDDLRRELESLGATFRGRSDTEVVVEGFARWGIAATVPRLIGMFAFAVWDRETRQLTLIRDRLGIKPLYWGRFGNTFVFGSELRALAAHPRVRPTVNRDAVADLVRCGYVTGTKSIYHEIDRVPPAGMITIDSKGHVTASRFWALPAEQPLALVAPDDAIAEVESLLRDAVTRRMVADVPLGAFLSGGIDSSTVTALMQAASPRPIKTFTIGFGHRDSREADYDEAVHARAVAAHLGTDHTEIRFDADQGAELIPKLPEFYDEPFADSSQIPTYLVSQVARRDVIVALSGDGGDEVFAGYTRHQFAARWPRLAALPRPARRLAGGALRSLSPATLESLISLLPESRRPPQAGMRLHKLGSVIGAASVAEAYDALVNYGDAFVLGSDGRPPRASEPQGDPVLWMQTNDLHGYLPDDVLTKVDRASMAVSLEVRVPILDHRVVEALWRLPTNLKIRDGTSKWLLRQILYRHVPQALVDRPKQGFAVPVTRWLRGPLRDWAETLLAANRLREEGFFDVVTLRRLWAEHLSGRYDRSGPLWGALMFQAWHEQAAAAA
jgi:asparagine synthase (glutamine-hydrolysing)